MGWRGALRSARASARAAKREAERKRKRELKAQIAADAYAAVEEWKAHIDSLLSIHTNLNDLVDWREVASRARPQKPDLQAAHGDRAEAKLNAFRPSALDVFWGGSDKRRRNLQQAVAMARARDRAEKDAAYEAYQEELREWEDDVALAQRLIEGDPASIKEVIEEMHEAFTDELIGPAISFDVSDSVVHAKPEIHTDDIIPKFRRKQLASGKLSETKMPIGQFNALYQDYAASVALKTAGDLFRVLPLDEIYVTCLTVMLNSSTGHKDLTPVLSVRFVRSIFMGLNLQMVDASDCISNFDHEMSFKKTKGFAPIRPLSEIRTLKA